jgi:hypothetical protein
MKVIILFFAWCALLVVCWPIALLALVVAPVVWLVAIPFRLVGVCVDATFAFVRAVLMLPARVLGHRG